MRIQSVVVLAATPCAGAAAHAQRYQLFDPPSATCSVATGINSSHLIVGDFAGVFNGTDTHQGYVLDQGVFTEFDFPGADETHPLGINNAGDITGSYCTNGNRCWPGLDTQGGHSHSFVKGAVTDASGVVRSFWRVSGN
jgi:hypothetical protein